MNIRFLRFDLIDSTNSEALRHARLGADEGLCIISRHQTAGRGRQGRIWVSENDAGLYYSIIFRPRIDPRFITLITLMAGVAAHGTLCEFRLAPDIKWVNDILVGEKKICGILAETTETDRGPAIVLGIGINIRSSNFPREIADRSTSIEEVLPIEPVRSVPSPEQLAQVLSNYLVHFYDVLGSDGGYTKILEEWRERSTYFSGKHVRVTLENEIIEGVTDGLEENGALRLISRDGGLKIVQAGDVERLRPVEAANASVTLVEL